MIYRMAEVLELVRVHGLVEASKRAYDIRLVEIAKASRFPYVILAVLAGVVYFALLLLAALCAPRARVPQHLETIVDDLAELYYYIPEIVIFKAIEIEAAIATGLHGRGLDLGCGNGRTGIALLNNSAIDELHGIDRSPYFAAFDRYASYVVGDACQLPYPSDSFDFVVSLGVIDHVPDLHAILLEANRVLRTGGRLVFIIQTTLFRESTFWYRTFRGIGASGLARDFQVYRDTYDMIYHYLDAEQWHDRLADSGFSAITLGHVFSARQLYFYDLLNMQTYFLKFFFAEHALKFIGRHPWLKRAVIRATARVSKRLLVPPATATTATRYLITAVK